MHTQTTTQHDEAEEDMIVTTNAKPWEMGSLLLALGTVLVTVAMAWATLATQVTNQSTLTRQSFEHMGTDMSNMNSELKNLNTQMRDLHDDNIRIRARMNDIEQKLRIAPYQEYK